MSIPAKKLLKAYLENLNRVLSDPEQLNEAVGWRGIVSEMAWKGQFPKGTAKPDVTLTNLMQHGWIDDAGNITDTFIYNPSETTASGNRYDQERREFYLTHLNTKEQIALASAYFKAGQALIDRYRKKVESSQSDSSALQTDTRILRKLIAKELESDQLFDKPNTLDIHPSFQRRLANINPEKLITHVELISSLGKKQQKNITKHKTAQLDVKQSKDVRDKHLMKEQFATQLKAAVDDYENGNITLGALKQEFEGVKTKLKLAQSRHGFKRGIKKSIKLIEEYETKFKPSASFERPTSPSSNHAEDKYSNHLQSSYDSDDATLSSEEDNEMAARYLTPNNQMASAAAASSSLPIRRNNFFSEAAERKTSGSISAPTFHAEGASPTSVNLFSKRAASLQVDKEVRPSSAPSASKDSDKDTPAGMLRPGHRRDGSNSK